MLPVAGLAGMADVDDMDTNWAMQWNVYARVEQTAIKTTEFGKTVRINSDCFT